MHFLLSVLIIGGLLGPTPATAFFAPKRFETRRIVSLLMGKNAMKQPKAPRKEAQMANRYGSMDLEERAFAILLDLGMVELTPGPYDDVIQKKARETELKQKTKKDAREKREDKIKAADEAKEKAMKELRQKAVEEAKVSAKEAEEQKRIQAKAKEIEEKLKAEKVARDSREDEMKAADEAKAKAVKELRQKDIEEAKAAIEEEEKEKKKIETRAKEIEEKAKAKEYAREKREREIQAMDGAKGEAMKGLRQRAVDEATARANEDEQVKKIKAQADEIAAKAKAKEEAGKKREDELKAATETKTKARDEARRQAKKEARAASKTKKSIAPVRAIKALGSAIRRARKQPESPQSKAELATRYAALPLEERAFTILLDLGMVELSPDPDDPKYDHSKDDEFVS